MNPTRRSMVRWMAVAPLAGALVPTVLLGCGSDDAGTTDTAATDTAATDTAATDTTRDTAATASSVEDSTVADTAIEDTAIEDTAIEDTPVADTAIEDTSVDDTAIADTGTDDVGTDDAGMADATPEVCTTTEDDAEGPFFVEDAPTVMDLSGDLPGEAIGMVGVIRDTACKPVAGAKVEVWQADKDGIYNDDQLRATLTADNDGVYAFTTIRPGPYEDAGGFRPAHFHYKVSAPGYETVTTQLYFKGDPYLSPNDSCGICGSDDQDRIIALVDTGSLKEGMFPVTLSAS
ncbi:MAG: protocatechuate 3,4-dioxygenase beta subunit [Myxococcota bacterium]|jgi:protocatechuate 3,4-dioxygenase beta subunit